MKNSTHKFPSRIQFNKECLQSVADVFKYYNYKNTDFSTEGVFEKQYTEAFSSFLNPNKKGYTYTVCSGTAAIYVALQSLQLKKGSEILVSAVTDPGMITPIVLLEMVPKIIDNQEHQPFTSLNQIKQRVSANTKALVLNHFSGIPIAEIKLICCWAKKNNLYVIEDCSQAHGAKVQNKIVGTFGDIACFSTMFSKNHSTGGCGGLIYTQNSRLGRLIYQYTNKGKPNHLHNFNPKDPRQFKRPALNLKIDEISCAIGYTTLRRLPAVNLKRRLFISKLSVKLIKLKVKTKIFENNSEHSPYFAILQFDFRKYNVSKKKFITDLQKLGLTLNGNYRYIVTEWLWIKKYLSDNFKPINAIRFRHNSFHLLFNENYKIKDLNFIANSILKIEQKYKISNI